MITRDQDSPRTRDPYGCPPPSPEAVEAARPSSRPLWPELDALIKRERQKLLQMTRRICGATHAEDVLQDAFVRALESRTTFRPDKGELSSWFRKIAANRAVDVARGESRRSTRTVEVEQDEAPSRSSSAPEPVSVLDLISRHQTHATVRAAIDRLVARDRDFLHQRYVQERSCAEIARDHGVSESVVSSCVTRALNRLARNPSLLALRSEIAHGGR